MLLCSSQAYCNAVHGMVFFQNASGLLQLGLVSDTRIRGRSCHRAMPHAFFTLCSSWEEQNVGLFLKHSYHFISFPDRPTKSWNQSWEGKPSAPVSWPTEQLSTCLVGKGANRKRLEESFSSRAHSRARDFRSSSLQAFGATCWDGRVLLRRRPLCQKERTWLGHPA